MGLKIVQLMDRALDARVAPSAYLVPLQSLTFGIFFFLFTSEPSVTQSILYMVGPPFGATLWGAGVTVGTLAFMASLWFKQKLLVTIFAMFLFAVWLGAAIAYIRAGFIFQFCLIFSQVLTYAYFFAANQTNRLWDYAPHKWEKD
mgnify:CR=1 FL=1